MRYFSIIVMFFLLSVSYSDEAFDLFQEGVEYHKEGDFVRAIEYYDMALELDPQLKFAWSNKGYALQDLGEYDDALRCYYRALEIDSGFADAWYNKACLHSVLGETSKMIYCLRKAIKFNEELRDYARTDPDFDNYRDLPEFIELVGSGE